MAWNEWDNMERRKRGMGETENRKIGATDDLGSDSSLPFDSVSPLHPFAVSQFLNIGMGEVVVAKEPCIISSAGIGSCVVVTLYDTWHRIGGMAHIMLPEAGQKIMNSGQCLVPRYEVNNLTPSPTPPPKGGAILKSPLERGVGVCNPSPLRGEGKGEGVKQFIHRHCLVNSKKELSTNNYSPLPCQYADTAVVFMLKEMLRAGALLENIVAKMAGGAKMFGYEEHYTENIGMENVRSVKKMLRKKKIPFIGEDVGGGHGRSVDFYLEAGRLVVRAIDREDREIFGDRQYSCRCISDRHQ